MRVAVAVLSCPFLSYEGRSSITIVEGTRVTHNAGVAGSSPAPAITQTVIGSCLSGLRSFFLHTCATTSATKTPQKRVDVVISVVIGAFTLAEHGAWL